MSKRYSLAAARANLSTILHEVERGADVELTRRGKPVAVVLSVHEYERLRGDRIDFGAAYGSFLAHHDLAEVGVEPGFADTVRDPSGGRGVAL